MKAFVFGLLVMLLGTSVYCQPQVIEVTTDRTVSLVFPSVVNHIDLGSATIDARLVGPGRKVVLVKALEATFKNTNLTIVTEGDNVYTFNVRYSSLPQQEQWTIAPKAPMPASYALAIIDNKRILQGVSDRNSGITAALQGIYAHDDHLYFQMAVDNATASRYDLEATRFLLVGRKGKRRAAFQELAFGPAFFVGEHKQVPVHGRITFVAVLPRFSVARNRKLLIDLTEHSGERNLSLEVSSRKCSRVALLPNL